jgi:hypothetical protein
MFLKLISRGQATSKSLEISKQINYLQFANCKSNSLTTKYQQNMNLFKLTLSVFLIFFAACNSPKEKAATISEPNEIKNAPKDIMDLNFVWDVKDFPKGRMMFLDVPYTVESKTEYLTLTVAKETSNQRPNFISVIVPNDLSDSKIMEIVFTYKNDSLTQTVYPMFENCHEDYCIFRMHNSYAVDKANNQVDVIRNFLRYDVVFFNFERKNGLKSSVSVPLFSFKEQYK